MSQEPTRLEMVSVDSKSWIKSKTVWAQIVTVALLVATFAIGPDSGLGLSDQVVAYIRLGIVLLNAITTVYFRSGAREGLDLRGQQRDVVAHVPTTPEAAVPPREFRSGP